MPPLQKRAAAGWKTSKTGLITSRVTVVGEEFFDRMRRERRERIAPDLRGERERVTKNQSMWPSLTNVV